MAKTISHYELLELIGRGGMGEVYRARDRRLDRVVAVKILPAWLTSDEASRKRLEREARAAAALSHPNIVTVYEFGEHEGRVFIVMELVEGRSLRDAMGDRPLPIDDALDIAIQLSEGLAKAHGRDVLHRDVKPENVIVDADGRAKLVDFGLAKLKDATQLTAPSATVGTVRYMSPEQAAGKELDPRTDVWSLGVMLYEMTAGEAPFRGEHPQAVVYSLTNEAHVPLTERRTNVPPELERIVDKMLAKRREERYPGMDDLLVDLRNLRSATVTRSRRRSRRSTVRRSVVFVIAATAITAVTWWAAHRQAQVAEASIAVLPFANMSENPDDDYFSDGLSEELLNALARVEGLHVAARTSSFQFKGRTGDVAEIGKQLNVATILEGSVRRSGDRLRITAQLVNARNGFHLWSETYDREPADVFAIQEDIAHRVVGELKVRLLPAGSEQLARRPTDNLQAYDAYLLGKHHLARRTNAALNQAVEYFKQAIALDPSFALAYVGLADCYRLLIDYGNLSQTESVPLQDSAIQRALELDDRLGEAYASLGRLGELQDRPSEALAAYEKAVELSPSYATAYQWYGAYLVSIDEHERAVALMRKAVELDPLSPTIHNTLGNELNRIGSFESALVEYRRAIELDPDYPMPYFNLGVVEYQEYGRIDAAIEWCRKGIERDPERYASRTRLGRYQLAAGRTDEALAEYQAIVRASPDYAPAYGFIGEFHRSQGRHAESLRWYRKAAELDPEDRWRPHTCFSVLLQLGDDRAAEAWIPHLADRQSLRARIQLHLFRREIAEAERKEDDYARQFDELRNVQAEFDLRAGRYAEVRARYAKAFPNLLTDDDPQVYSANAGAVVNLAAALLRTGEEDRARRLLAKGARHMERYSESQRRLEGPTLLVEVYALQGRTREALDELRRAVDAGWREAWWYLEIAPNLASLHGTPEFTAIMERLRSEVAKERAQLTAEDKAPL